MLFSVHLVNLIKC